MPGHKPFVGVGADASIASLALAALDVLPGGSVMVFDPEMRYVLVRGRALFDRGFSSAFLEGRLVADALSADRWAFYEPLYRSALLGETHSVEVASPDGEGWYAVEVGPLRAGDGEIIGGVSFAVGITERKRVEQQLLAVVDLAPDASVLADGEGRIVRANAHTELLFGYTLGELIGQQVEMLIPERFRNAHVGQRERYFVDPQVRPVGVWLEVTGRRKDGSEFPIEVSLSPLETADGKLIVSAIRDLTERKRAEAELARLASIVAAAHDAIFSLDMDGRVTTWNEAAEALLGYSAEEILGRDVSCMVPENQREEPGAPRGRALAGDAVGRADTQRMHKDGSLVDVAITAFPLLDAAGQQTGAAAIMRDIRESVRQTRELAASEQRYREILEHTPDGVIRLDVESRVDYVNERMAEILGYSPDEMIGWHVGELIDPDEREASEQNIEHDRVRMAGRVVERRLQCKDRRLCWARISTTALFDGERNYRGALAVISDITEAKSRESDLRSSESFVAAIADSMAEGMFAIDREGCLTYMNHAAERMLGWKQEELKGHLIHEVVHSVRKDGSAYPVEECPMVKVRETGVPVRVGDDVFVRRGGELLPVAYSSAPLESDGTSGAVVVFHDITAMKSEQVRVARELVELTWVGRIRDALDEDRFVLYAQPIVELRSGAVTQHELLIRMVDRDGTLIAPDRFLPTAERLGLIEEIDHWVIGEAARLVGGEQAVTLQFNLSGKSLAHANLAEKIQSALREHGADPTSLICELTETALLEQAELGEAFVGQLNALGCKVALDDFGTGYGGFTFLKRLPVSYLKIDVEFVRDLVENPASRHVVAAIVSLARGFGQQTIAEGVEDERTLELLREMGVDYAQGYAIARPGPVEEVLKIGAQDLGSKAEQP